MNLLRRLFVPTTIAAAVIATSGCALTSKADLIGTRYYTPERPGTHLHSASVGGAPRPASGVVVRLGRITSGAHLRERIAYRDTAHEIGYYDDKLWTERPEAYVRRRLSWTLFEEHGFQHALGGSAPTLEVEVLAFDEVRTSTGRTARVELKVVLYEDRLVLYEETISTDHAVPTGGGKAAIDHFVVAMAMALEASTEVIATRIANVRPERPPP
jgi:cholesterol transport system auxiliary component